jgi:hypothetical protein
MTGGCAGEMTTYAFVVEFQQFCQKKDKNTGPGVAMLFGLQCQIVFQRVTGQSRDGTFSESSLRRRVRT